MRRLAICNQKCLFTLFIMPAELICLLRISWGSFQWKNIKNLSNICTSLKSVNILKTGFDISCKSSPLETICMKCQILFAGKNKKPISKCRLLKILTIVLSVKWNGHTFKGNNFEPKYLPYFSQGWVGSIFLKNRHLFLSKKGLINWYIVLIQS